MESGPSSENKRASAYAAFGRSGETGPSCGRSLDTRLLISKSAEPGNEGMAGSEALNVLRHDLAAEFSSTDLRNRSGRPDGLCEWDSWPD